VTIEEHPRIPVFLHIPRNAGTYVLSVTMAFFRFYGLQMEWGEKRDCPLDLCRYRLLNSHKKQLATLFIYDPKGTRKRSKSIEPHPQCPNACTVDEEGVNGVLKELKDGAADLFAIIIEPRGAGLVKNGYFDMVCEQAGKRPEYFTVLRNPYERAFSLYSYLTNSGSRHEPTHGTIAASSFDEYIRSSQLEESWLIRNLCGIFDGAPITEENFEEACLILSKFKMADVSKTDALIEEVFRKCYGLNRSAIQDERDFNKNATSGVKRNLCDLDEETQDLFLERTKFDLRLYKYFIEL